MVPLTPWYVLAGAATLINGGVLGYMSWREGSRALRLWAWAWLAWAAAVFPLHWLEGHRGARGAAVSCGVAWVASTLCFLAGSYRFSERPLPRSWYAIAATCAIAALVGRLDPSDGWGMIPLVLFHAGGLTTAGIVIIRAGRGRTGAWLGGGSLIGLALHLFDAPFLAARPGLMAWGFVVATALEILAALGMITLYYEHARGQLLVAWRALAETRRLEALGRVAGGVAHDFNNMLTVMQGHLELVRMGTEGTEPVASSLQVMEQAVAQAGRLTAQLLAFGRRSVLQPADIDVRQVISETLTLLRKVIPSNIEVRFRCAEASYAASMDRSLLEQIVLNLVTNARDAIAGRGHIWVELERTDSSSPGLLLCVADDGSGMDEGVLSHVFEPFFTTKGTGRGTGLGLASVQGAVSQLGGRIGVESRPGHGTRFEVRLPLVPAAAASLQAPEPIHTGPLDILIVDDADPVREVSARLLENAGHRVRQAKDGTEALDMLQASRCDVILSDVVMPRMGGLELAAAVAKLRPEVLMVLTSGYPRGAEVDPAAVRYLPKPFKPAALLDAIERLVAEHRQQRGDASAPH